MDTWPLLKAYVGKKDSVLCPWMLLSELCGGGMLMVFKEAWNACVRHAPFQAGVLASGCESAAPFIPRTVVGAASFVNPQHCMVLVTSQPHIAWLKRLQEHATNARLHVNKESKVEPGKGGKKVIGQKNGTDK
eukprot:scaffold184690_cov21-Tisochrysis_lutea.AAC.2